MDIPRVYREPFNVPLRWQDEQSDLPAAITAFIQYGADRRAPSPTAEQLELVRAYCEYYIAAPCWKTDEEFEVLRTHIKALKSFEEIDTWIHDALKVGIDPL